MDLQAALTGGTSSAGASGMFTGGGLKVNKGITGTQILLGVVTITGGFVLWKFLKPAEKRKGK